METNTKVGLATGLLDMSFEPEIEQAFQDDYYKRVRATLRVTSIILGALSVVLAVFHLVFFGSAFFCLTAGANLFLVGLAHREDFAENWQPSLVGLSLLALVAPIFLMRWDSGHNPIPALYIGVFCILFGLRIWRLQAQWVVLLCGGILLLGSVATLRGSHGWGDVLGFGFSATVPMLLPIILSRRQERFDRRMFLNTYRLTEERNEERRKREQTEKMLKVLSQAIGSIVHDLGNPLTTVQTGAETLLQCTKDPEVDKELVAEFATMITDGAQMLNYLRLSLMEETCVLEGKTSPVEPSPVSLHDIIEAGAHYQKPRFAIGRQVTLPDDDLEVCVDRMKFVTVFMNLIGNALKYSDGEVRISWRTEGEHFLVAVKDEGKAGRGITQAQAEQLFVPFGRLDEHMQVEGTGLGLLSVRKIIEAHGGEVYIEGYTNGTPASVAFTTAQHSYPRCLEPDFQQSRETAPRDAKFRTAFVVACPLAQESETCDISEAAAHSPTTAARHLEPELAPPAPMPSPVSQERPLHPAQPSPLE